jgi:hypothetical protein
MERKQFVGHFAIGLLAIGLPSGVQPGMPWKW